MDGNQTEVVPWQNQEICIVENVKQCQDLATKIRSHCTNYNVLGIGRFIDNKKIAVLLLSTHGGLSALIRLSILQRVPTELKKILEDENILKVTVDPVKIAIKLVANGVSVASLFDLRYLATKCNAKDLSLMGLSAKFLKFQFPENDRIHRDWRKNTLQERDVQYAANSVRIPIELFKLFEEKLKVTSSVVGVQRFIDEHCKEYLNRTFPTVAENQTVANVDGVQIETTLPKPTICLINTVEKCKTVVEQLLLHCSEYRVLGFCCKYNASGNGITLLQLATHHGFCAFIQFGKFKIPDELKELLKDESIIKVGGKVFADADRLIRDYGIDVANTIDLRHLAKACNYSSMELDRLSRKNLYEDTSVDDWRLLVISWRAKRFSDDELIYGAKSVQISIALFKMFEDKLLEEKYAGDRDKFIIDICTQYSNEDFPKREAQNHFQDGTGTLPEQNIQVVSTAEECKTVVEQLLSDCNEYNVLGFDCEWLPYGRPKVALLQLGTHRGLCALIRLCKMESIPIELREILKDEKILKVGFSPEQDANKLAQDYGLEVKGTLDLSHLAKKCHYKGGGVGSLAEEVLNVNLPFKKRGLVRCRMYKKWENHTLPDENIKYAANDVHVSIELFKKFREKLTTENTATSDSQTEKLQDFIDQHCTAHVK